MTSQFLGEMTAMAHPVLSGGILARGIDTEAHEGALSVEGKTAAVLGRGPDIIYPPENLELHRRIADTGAVISEFPFGRRADKQTFPMRNRVVAGLCEAVSGLSGRGIAEVSSTLMMLELKKLLRKRADGNFELAG